MKGKRTPGGHSSAGGSSPGGAGNAGGWAGEVSKPLPGPVMRAQFALADRLVLLASGPALYLYSYRLHPSTDPAGHKLVDVPGQHANRYKLAHRYQLAQAQTVSAFTAPNTAGGGGLLVAAGSDKSLELIDLETGGTAGAIAAAHDRPVHCVAAVEASAGTAGLLPAEAAHLFLTAAVDGTVKLWDMRSLRQCSMVFSAHTNRVQPVGCALSPCARFVGCGSEDKLGYLYDVRAGARTQPTALPTTNSSLPTYISHHQHLDCTFQPAVPAGGAALKKLRGHTDAVLAVAFNPMHPQLVTAGADGRLCFFASA